MEVMLVPQQAASQSRLAPHTLSFALTLILEAEQGEENGRAKMRTERLELGALSSALCWDQAEVQASKQGWAPNIFEQAEQVSSKFRAYLNLISTPIA